MTTARTRSIRLAVLALLALLGTAAAIYVLSQQSGGIQDPFSERYRIKAELTSAAGVRPSVGQPVNVAGVAVGQIVGLAATDAGNAAVTLEIRRSDLAVVHRDATARLEPITPLKDLQIALNPGTASAGRLPDGGTIPVGQTAVPAELSTLLRSLDTDNRAFLTSLISAVGDGTRGRGNDLRRALVALGPTTHQLHRVTTTLAGRRREIARLVHNLARVTRAAARDDQLAQLVVAGNQTLAAVASQDPALRAALDKLPRGLRSADRTLTDLASLSREIGPTTRALLPALADLPKTLAGVQGLSEQLTADLPSKIRPFVREAQPLLRDLGAAAPGLTRLAPRTTNILKSTNYLLNELAYNPPGDDEGGLFWIAWTLHNFLSAGGTTGDAHGTIIRGLPFVTCAPVQQTVGEINTIFMAALNLNALCPSAPGPVSARKGR